MTTGQIIAVITVFTTVCVGAWLWSGWVLGLVRKRGPERLRAWADRHPRLKRWLS